MSDYKNGKIYEIVCNITGEVYIGSTVQSLEERLCKHKCKKTHTCTSKQIIDRGNYYIELLETYPCETKHELLLKETEYQKNIKCINKVMACRSKQEWIKDNKEIILQKTKEYFKDNKEIILQRNKEYRDANKELISQRHKIKVECECGSIIRVTDLAKHKRTQKHLKYISTLPCVSPLLPGTAVEGPRDSSCSPSVNVSVQKQD